MGGNVEKYKVFEKSGEKKNGEWQDYINGNYNWRESERVELLY